MADVKLQFPCKVWMRSNASRLAYEFDLSRETTSDYVEKDAHYRKKDWQVLSSDDVWAELNRHKIAKEVARCFDTTVLRQIADLIGWKEPEGEGRA